MVTKVINDVVTQVINELQQGEEEQCKGSIEGGEK